jgi:hypothetical protein
MNRLERDLLRSAERFAQAMVEYVHLG